MSERALRAALVVLLLFVGIPAVAGALFVVPALPIEWLRWGPFTDYTVPAIALGIVGLLAIASALGVVSVPHLGALTSIAVGLAMIAFEVVEVAVVGIALLEFPTHPASWLQPIYVAVGIAIVALAAALYRGGVVRPSRTRRGIPAVAASTSPGLR